MYEPELVEEALRRYSPAIVALTTETRETVDVAPVLAHLARDAVAWRGVTVIDRLEACQWFAQSATEPAMAATVAEVKAQLAAPLAMGSAEGQSAALPDAALSATCLKHKLIHVAVGRERARRAAIAAEEAEYEAMVADLIEDGMGEAEAAAEARRTMEENRDEEPDDEDAPIVRDVVIVKGFPNTAAEVLAIDRMGMPLNAIVILNSTARFGRREELERLDPKDGKAAARKRPDVRRPDNKRGRSGKDDTDRAEPLSLQMERELARLETFEASPLREVLLWSYDVPCADAPPTEDGSRAVIAKESEAATSEKVAAAFVDAVEKVFRYREWVARQSYARVPMLRPRGAEDGASKAAVPATPAPVPSPAAKGARKPRTTKQEPEPTREDAPPRPPPPSQKAVCGSVADLPTPLSIVDGVAERGASEPLASAELLTFASVLQAAEHAAAASVGDGHAAGRFPKRVALSPAGASEVAAEAFLAALLSGLSCAKPPPSAAASAFSKAWSRATSELPSVPAPNVAGASNAFLALDMAAPTPTGAPSPSMGKKSTDTSGGHEGIANVLSAVRRGALSSLLGRDAQPLADETIGGAFAAAERAVGAPTKATSANNQQRVVEYASGESLAQRVFADALRGDAEGYALASFKGPKGLAVLAKRGGAAAGGRDRFRRSWFLFQGRLPFPVWASMEGTMKEEHAHYCPPMGDEDEPEEPEEEEEEEDTFDDDGNLLPKKVRTYPITFRNDSVAALALIRRRAVYDTLQQFLAPAAAAVVLAPNGGATSLSDEHTVMYPDDGSAISARILRGSTEQGICAAHSSCGRATFGFVTSPQAPSVPDRRGYIGSGVRAFFSTAGGLRVSAEASVYSPAQPTAAAVPVDAAADTSLLPIAATTSNANASASLPKRSNTPRSTSTGRPNAAGPAAPTPIQEDTPPPPAPAAAPAAVLRTEPPRTHLSVVVGGGTAVAVTAEEATITLSPPIRYTAVVGSPSGLEEVADEATHMVVRGAGQSITLVGSRTRLRLFASGDVAAYCDGHWLLTAVGTGNRLLRGEGEARPVAVAPVLMATTILGGCTAITRDDGVRIVAAPGITISLPGGIVLEKGSAAGVGSNNVFAVPNGLRIAMGGANEGVGSNVCTLSFACGAVLALAAGRGEGASAMGPLAMAAHVSSPARAVFDFSSALLYCSSGEGHHRSPLVHTIDAMYGGLRVHDSRDAFHVTPLMRCRHVTRDEETAPLPTDLTVRHSVDVFVEAPEVISAPFEAAVAASPYPRGLAASLHMCPLPPVPEAVQHLLTAAVAEPQPIPQSLYAAEKTAQFRTRLAAFGEAHATSAAPLGAAHVYAVSGGDGWASSAVPDGVECAAAAVLGNGILSDVVVRREDCGAVVTEVVACPLATSEEGSCVEANGGSSSDAKRRGVPADGFVRAFYTCPPSAPARLPPPSLEATLKAAVSAVPRAIVAQLDEAIGDVFPQPSERLGVAPPTPQWPQPVPALHSDLAAISREEARYWASSARPKASDVLPVDVAAIKSAGAAATASPLRSARPKPQAADRSTTADGAAVTKPPPAVKAAVPAAALSDHAAASGVAFPPRGVFTNPQPPERVKRPPRRVLVPTPASLDAGLVMERFRYSIRLQLTNVSTAVCRFRVTADAPWLSVQYRMAPLAPGITTPVDVELTGRQPVGAQSAAITVAHEGGSFEVPLTLECYPADGKVVVPPNESLRLIGPL